MRFVRCGSKMFRPDTVTAVDLASGPAKEDVLVALPNCGLTFQGPEAEAVRAFFNSIPTSDLMHQYEAEATGIFGERIPARSGVTDVLRRDEEPTEQVAANHDEREC